GGVPGLAGEDGGDATSGSIGLVAGGAAATSCGKARAGSEPGGGDCSSQADIGPASGFSPLAAAGTFAPASTSTRHSLFSLAILCCCQRCSTSAGAFRPGKKLSSL